MHWRSPPFVDGIWIATATTAAAAGSRWGWKRKRRRERRERVAFSSVGMCRRASADWNMEQCVRTRHPSEPFSRASMIRPLGPPRFSSLLAKRRSHPSTAGTTSTTTDELLDEQSCALALRISMLSHQPPFSFSPFPPPIYPLTNTSALPLPHLELTTYTTTSSLSNGSLSRFALLPAWPPHFSLSPTASFLLVLFSTIARYRFVLLLSLFLSLSFLFSSSFSSRFLASARRFSLPSRSPASPCSALARRHLTRALILSCPPPRL